MGRICPNCGNTVEENAKFCDECGSALPYDAQELEQEKSQDAQKINMYQTNWADSNQANSTPKNQPPYQNINMYSADSNTQSASSGVGALAIVSLIAGILSILTLGCAFIPQIVAIICSLLSKKNKGRMNAIAKAGLITGIIGAVLCLIMIILIVCAQ